MVYTRHHPPDRSNWLCNHLPGVSIVDRCSLCPIIHIPAGEIHLVIPAEMMSREENGEFVRVATKAGVRKV